VCFAFHDKIKRFEETFVPIVDMIYEEGLENDDDEIFDVFRLNDSIRITIKLSHTSRVIEHEFQKTGRGYNYTATYFPEIGVEERSINNCVINETGKWLCSHDNVYTKKDE
jgi:hypothetical protein